MKGEPLLTHIVGTRTPPGGFACRLHRREQQPHERANDGDHDQQFHERETLPTVLGWHLLTSLNLFHDNTFSVDVSSTWITASMR
jgi:hypothetical protein